MRLPFATFIFYHEIYNRMWLVLSIVIRVLHKFSLNDIPIQVHTPFPLEYSKGVIFWNREIWALQTTPLNFVKTTTTMDLLKIQLLLQLYQNLLLKMNCSNLFISESNMSLNMLTAFRRELDTDFRDSMKKCVSTD